MGVWNNCSGQTAGNKHLKGLYTLLAVLLLNASIVRSQSFQWVQTSNVASYANSYNTATDANGNVYHCGSFTTMAVTFGAITLSNTGTSGIFLVKYDALGNLLWARTQNGGYGGEARAVHTDTNGNVFVSGNFSVSITFSNTTFIASGNPDVFLTKYDSGGNFLWARRGGGTGIDMVYSSCSDVSGNSYIAGTSGSTLAAWGSYSVSTPNLGDFINAFVVKYDSQGNETWLRNSQGWAPFYNRFGSSSVGCDPSGNVYLVGTYGFTQAVFGAFTLTNGVYGNMFLVKYNSAGTEQWVTGSTNSGGNGARGVALSVDAQGNSYVGVDLVDYSVTIGNQVFTRPNPGSNVAGILCKFDTNGNYIWGNNIQDVLIHSISAHAGGAFVTGPIIGALQIGNFPLVFTPSGPKIFFLHCNSLGTITTATCLSNAGDGEGDIHHSAVAHTDGCTAYITGDYAMQPNVFPINNTTLYVNPGSQAAYTTRVDLGLQATVSGNTVICPDNSAVLTASGSPTYSWSNGMNTSSIIVTPSVTSVYSLEVTSCGQPSYAITVSVNPSPSFTVSASTPSVCLGNSVSLTATGNNTFSWSGGISNGISFTPAVTSVYTLSVISPPGCSSTSVYPVQVFPLPVFTVAIPSPSVCFGTSVTLNATGIGTFSWSGGISNGVPFTPGATSVYSLIATTSAGCTSYSTYPVGVIQQPTVNTVSTATLLCSGDPANMSASGALSYTWYPGNLTGASLTVFPTSNTTYTVSGSNAQGCSASASITLLVDLCTGMEANAQDPVSRVKLYPNPGHDLFNIVLNENARVTVTNSFGSVLFIQDLTKGKQVFDLRDYADGIYFVRIIFDKDKQETLRLIKN